MTKNEWLEIGYKNNWLRNGKGLTYITSVK